MNARRTLQEMNGQSQSYSANDKVWVRVGSKHYQGEVVDVEGDDILVNYHWPDQVSGRQGTSNTIVKAKDLTPIKS